MTGQWQSFHRAIGLIDGRWTVAVLAELLEGGRRYQELDGALEGISHKVLTDTLRRSDEPNGTALLCASSIQVALIPHPFTN